MQRSFFSDRRINDLWARRRTKTVSTLSKANGDPSLALFRKLGRLDRRIQASECNYILLKTSVVEEWTYWIETRDFDSLSLNFDTSMINFFEKWVGVEFRVKQFVSTSQNYNSNLFNFFIITWTISSSLQTSIKYKINCKHSLKQNKTLILYIIILTLYVRIF